MADAIDNGTAPSSNAGTPGGGTPNDVPASTPRVYSQEEFDTNSAKLRAAVTDQVTKKRDGEWLQKLGVASFDEAAAKLKQVQEQQQKPEKTEAQIVAEKIQADFQRIIAEKDKALADAQQALQAEAQRAAEEKRRAFLLQHVHDTTDPALAMALFGVAYTAHREIRMVDGKPTVFEDGVALDHVPAEQHVKETLAKPEFAFLRKPTSTGSGTRPGAGSSPAAPPPAPQLRRGSSMQDEIAVAIAAGVASRANGSGR